MNKSNMPDRSRLCPFCKSDDISTRAVHSHADHTCHGCKRTFRDGQRYAKKLMVICDDCGIVEVWPIVCVNGFDDGGHEDGYGDEAELEVKISCPNCNKPLFNGEITAGKYYDCEVINAVENGAGDDSLIHDPDETKKQSWIVTMKEDISFWEQVEEIEKARGAYLTKQWRNKHDK